MKNLWLAVFVLYMITTSCEKDILVEPITPPVLVEKPKVELTITPSEVMVPYGAKRTVAWATDPKNICKLNNEIVKPNDSKEVQLFENTSYTVSASNGTASTIVDKTVTVGDWTSSKLGLLTYKPWKLKSWRIVPNDGGKIIYLQLTNEELSYSFNFNLKGSVIVTDPSGKIIADDPWSFDKDETHFISGHSTLITKLTETEVSFGDETFHKGQPALFEITYYRP